VASPLPGGDSQQPRCGCRSSRRQPIHVAGQQPRNDPYPAL